MASTFTSLDRPLARGGLCGVARPTMALRKKLGLLGARDLPMERQIEAVVNNAVAVDALAALLTKTIERHQKPDGGVCMKDVAADVLAVLMENQR